MLAKLKDGTERIVQVPAFSDPRTGAWLPIQTLHGAKLRTATPKDEYDHGSIQACAWCRREVSQEALARLPMLAPVFTDDAPYCCVECHDLHTKAIAAEVEAAAAAEKKEKP